MNESSQENKPIRYPRSLDQYRRSSTLYLSGMMPNPWPNRLVWIAVGAMALLALLVTINLFRGHLFIPILTGTLHIHVTNQTEQSIGDIHVFESTDLGYIPDLPPGADEWCTIHPASASELFIAYTPAGGVQQVRLVGYYAMYISNESIQIDIVGGEPSTVHLTILR